MMKQMKSEEQARTNKQKKKISEQVQNPICLKEFWDMGYGFRMVLIFSLFTFDSKESLEIWKRRARIGVW